MKLENILIIILLTFVYSLSLFVPLNDNDSAHHATIALNMFLNNNVISLISHGEPYLDKPHFQFWLLYFSYKLFGVSTFAYKISSLFFTILTLFSTYKLTKHIFNKEIAKNATLIIATSFAFMMGNVDIRMDAILTGGVVFSVYKLVQYFDDKKWITLILASLGIGITFSTKGIFGVAIIGLISLFYAIHKGIFKELFQLKFLSIIPLFFLFILPVLIAYYIQFDMHPETIVRGTTGNSGVKFILFHQSFSRMGGKEFGESSSNDYFFFFHTLLWSIIPWSLLYCVGVFNQMKKSIQEKKLFSDTSLSLVFPVLLIFIVMGISKFKLPHYMLPVYPFTAIFIAYYVSGLSKDSLKKWNIIQNIQYVLLIITGIILNYWVFSTESIWLSIFYVFLAFLVFYNLLKSKNLILKGTWICILFWIPFNSNFFPKLLSFQGGQNIAKSVNKLKLNNENILYFGAIDLPYSFDYYTAHIHKFCTIEELKIRKSRKLETYLFVEYKDLKQLGENKLFFKLINKAKDFRITVLTGKFLNPNSRKKVVNYVYLVKLN
ncbi:MAG: ArnT family glycosyltransferase [Solirubrobacteraceae bacterium]